MHITKIPSVLLLNFTQILVKLFHTVSDFEKLRHWTKSKQAAGKMKQEIRANLVHLV